MQDVRAFGLFAFLEGRLGFGVEADEGCLHELPEGQSRLPLVGHHKDPLQIKPLEGFHDFDGCFVRCRGIWHSESELVRLLPRLADDSSVRDRDQARAGLQRVLRAGLHYQTVEPLCSRVWVLDLESLPIGGI